jgi:hypothetical protein
MKACRKNRKNIAWLVMDELSRDEAAGLVTHIDRCEGCRVYRDQILSVKKRVHALQDLTPESSLDSEILAMPRPAQTNPPNRAPRLAFAWCLVGAVTCVLALVSILMSSLNHSPSVQRNSHHSGQPAPRVSSRDLLPTFATYRTIGNQSLDRLDQLLTQQSHSSRSAPQPPTAGSLGVPNLED